MSEMNAEIAPWSLTLEQARDQMLQGLLQGTPGHYRIGKLYNYVVKYRLAVDQGHRTTREYFRHHVPVLSQARLTMYGAVVRRFSLEACEKYGMLSLGMLLEYARLAHIRSRDLDKNEPGPTPIEIPRKGGLAITKPFSDCTAADLRQAVRTRRAWLGQGTRDEHEERVERYVELLKQHFAQNARWAPQIDVEVNNLRLHLRVRHLRMIDLEPLTEALLRTLKPSEPASVGVSARLGS
jgi:hypothetical protein